MRVREQLSEVAADLKAHPKKIWTIAGTSLGLTLLIQFAAFNGLLEGAENRVLDWLLAGSASSGWLTDRPIYTVEIDDAAYRDFFKSRSPLDPKLVLNVVEALARTPAQVIGVDILTEDDIYSTLGRNRLLADKVVWMAGVEEHKSTSLSILHWLGGEEEVIRVKPTRVLGREYPAFQRDTPFSGIAVYPSDSDQHLRRLPGHVELLPNGRSSTFARQIANRACDNCAEDRPETVFLRYDGPRVIRGLIQEMFELQGSQLVMIKPTTLRPGSIVLLGGTFQAARDSYETPTGRMPGLLINAVAVRAELSPNILHPERRPLALTIDFLCGCLVGLTFLWYKHRAKDAKPVPFYKPAMVACGMGLLASLLAIALVGRAYIPGLIGVFLGMFLHQFLELWKENREREKHAAATP